MKQQQVPQPQGIQALLEKAVQEKDVDTLCRVLFDFKATPSQQHLIRRLVWPGETTRFWLSAFTRYGKTQCIALAVALIVLLWKRSDPFDINVASATMAQAMRVRRYFAQALVRCPLLSALLIDPKEGESARLQAERTKTRLAFHGKYVNFYTAHGAAEGLMGEGGLVNFLDEAGLVDDETYTDKFQRMAGDHDDAILIETGNPWDPNSEFARSHDDPDYLVIQVDAETGVKEGRITRKYLEERRRRLSPISFTVLYESRFPEEAEDALYKWDHIVRAIKRKPPTGKPDAVRWMLDVAEGGRDKNVLTRTSIIGGFAKIEVMDEWFEPDTEQTAKRAMKNVPPDEEINVDCIGVGKGVYDKLRAEGWNAKEYRASFKPVEREQATNLKTESYWALRDLLEAGRCSLPDHKDLLGDLRRARYKERNGKDFVFVVDEDKNSPDHGDSVVGSLVCVEREIGLAFGGVDRA